MKNFLLSIFFLLALAGNITAQKTSSEKIQSLKIAFITERLQLTSSEAQKFWPIYNDYEKEISKQWQAYENGGIPVLDNEEKLLKVKLKYRSSFEKVLGKDKVNKFYLAEQDFRGVLIHSLQHRKNQGRQR